MQKLHLSHMMYVHNEAVELTFVDLCMYFIILTI